MAAQSNLPSKPMVPSVANPCAMPMPKPISWPEPTPRFGQGADGLAHFQGHEHSLERRVLDWHRIVEDHHRARGDPVYTFTPIATVPRRPA